MTVAVLPAVVVAVPGTVLGPYLHEQFNLATLVQKLARHFEIVIRLHGVSAWLGS